MSDSVMVKRVDGPELKGMLVKTHIRDHRNAAQGTAGFIIAQALEWDIGMEWNVRDAHDPGILTEMTEMIDRLYVLRLTYFCGLPEPDVSRIDDMAHSFITPELEGFLAGTSKDAYIITYIDDGCVEHIKRMTDIDAVLEGQARRPTIAKNHFTESILINTIFTDEEHNTITRLSDLNEGGANERA